LFTAAVLLAPGHARAQAIYGAINGTVLDQSGAAVPGATVTVTDVNKDTEKVVKTNETGAYIVHDLIPDPYVVKVEAAGFSKAVSDPINVAADSASELNVSLKVGTGAQTVEVTSATPELKTDRADVATELDTLAVEETPNLIRNVTSLVLLAPGTTASTFSNANAEDPQRSIPIAANGQSPFSSGFILDGANDKDSFIGEAVVNPPLESIAEVKFINQDYDAEFGAAIAGVTVMQTKSGSNKFHGAAYEFRRSDAQQARDPFTQYPGNNPLGPDIPNTLSNLFGGSVGGPIMRDKLFFFGDYQGTRQKIGNSYTETVPTAEVHNTCTGTGSGYCDLSEYLQYNQSHQLTGGQAYDPYTGVVTNGVNTGVGRSPLVNPSTGELNQILNSRISPEAVNLLKIIPMPSTAGISSNFVASGFGVYNFNQYDTRIDAQLKQNLHIFGRYGYLGSTQSSPASLGEAGGGGFGAGGWAGTESGGNDSVAVGADIAVSPKLVTDFRYSYFRYAFVEAKYDGQTALMNNLGWTGLNTSALNSGGAPEISIDGLTTLGSGNHGANHCNCPLDMTEQENGFTNNWTLDHGQHSIKFGGELRILHEVRIPSDTNRTGEIYFDQHRTSLNGSSVSTGLGMASVLFGDVSTFSRFFSIATSNPSAETQPRLFFYLQDNWRVTPKLTINLGGRWENYFPESVNGKDQGGFYNYQTDMIEVAGEGPYNDSMNIKNNWSLLAPRLGFAYQITQKGVIRGGLGRAFDPGFYGDIFGATFSQTIPVLQTQQESDPTNTDAARNNDGSVYNIASGPSAPTSAFNIPASGEFILPVNQGGNSRPTTVRVPDVYGWNVAYQQQLTSSTAVTVAYVANKASHTLAGSTWGGLNWNDPPIAGWALGLNNAPNCPLYPFYQKFAQYYAGDGYNATCNNGYFTLYDHEANAHYNSLQAIIDKRFSSGLQFQGSYVYSKAIGVGTQGYFVQDPHANWGRFDFNRDSNFKFNSSYFLPFGRGQQFGANMSPVADAIVGGFSLNGNLNWATGLPFNPSYGECGTSTDAPHYDMPCRPNLVGSFSDGAKSLSTSTHSAIYFNPVTAFGANGSTSGAFQRPAAYTFGSMEYGSLTGPGLFTTDVTLNKAITLREDLKLTFDVQAQNIFNHPNLSNPSSGCIDCTQNPANGQNAGVIKDIEGGTFAGMRQLQFAAHINF
jgi:hypothetical protein